MVVESDLLDHKEDKNVSLESSTNKCYTGKALQSFRIQGNDSIH